MLGLRRGNGSMRRLSLIVLSVLVVVAGCGTATVTTTQPLTGDRPRPDRVIVQDFGVNAPADERRDGQAVAKTLTDTLITTLSDHGIDAFHTSATPLPGARTASILGEVVYVPGGQEIRARIQVYQGAGSNTRLIAEMEANTPRSLIPGTDARRTAEAIAARIGEFYRRQGWPWREPGPMSRPRTSRCGKGA